MKYNNNLFIFLFISIACILFLLISYKLLIKSSFENKTKNKIKKKKIVKKNAPSVKKNKIEEHYQTDFNKVIVMKQLKEEIKEELKKEMEQNNPLREREPEHIHQALQHNVPINVETRESAGEMKQLGICNKIDNVNQSFNSPGNNDDTVILALWGKRLYRRSNNWNYYIVSEKNNFKIPLIINDKNCSEQTGCKEIMDNDIINIPQYNGTFKVKLYKLDYPKYIPYI